MASDSGADGLTTFDGGNEGVDSDASSDDGIQSTGDGPRLDEMMETGENGTAEAGQEEGCKAVDFLFVIDNSGSMGDNQDALVASFGSFMQSILDTVDASDDFHVMVVKTDSGWFPESCNVFCQVACGPDLPAGLCDNKTPPDSCADQLGAGVTYPVGGDSSNQQCSLSGGQRYIQSTEPNLTTAFSCVAQVGTDGNADERPMEALTAALSNSMQNPGGCNEGFLRDDAILVVTVITDEEDANSPGTPEGWYQNLLSAKALDPSAFVMLGLINDTDAASPLCPSDSQDPVRLRSFFEMFPNRIFGSVCNTSGYGEFFAQAVELIDTTCDEFVPPAD